MKIFLTTVLFTVSLFSIAQTTLTLQPGPEQGKDAVLHGLDGWKDQNLGNREMFPANAWTFEGDFGAVRSIVGFDLSTIPTGSTVLSASLDLYAWNDPSQMGPHETYEGENEGWLERVTSDWEEHLTTWNTQPSTTTAHRVSLRSSNGPDDDYLGVDVTQLIQDMVDDPAESFGLMMRMKIEEAHRKLVFCSSDHPDSNKRPRLTIVYKEPIVLDLTGIEGEDELLVMPDLSEGHQEVSVHPNPISNSLFIHSQEPIVHVYVKDVKGGLVMDKTVSTFSVSALLPGTYMVIVELASGNIQTASFIKR